MSQLWPSLFYYKDHDRTLIGAMFPPETNTHSVGRMMQIGQLVHIGWHKWATIPENFIGQTREEALSKLSDYLQAQVACATAMFGDNGP